MSAQQHPWERRLLAWAAEGLEYGPPVQTPCGTLVSSIRPTRTAIRSPASRAGHSTKRRGFCPTRNGVRCGRCTPSAGSPMTSSTGRGTSRKRCWRPGSSVPCLCRWQRHRRRTTWWWWRGPTRRACYRIPTAYAEQLIDGVAHDLTTTRYASFDDLVAYCYGVASTVGLLSMHIIGFAGREAIPYAVKLGVALQLTNILRDVREDWAAGRVYLPQEELAAFGLERC